MDKATTSKFLLRKRPTSEKLVDIGFKNIVVAGEVIDIDGVTGGYNFQHCWTSGWVAGNSVV